LVYLHTAFSIIGVRVTIACQLRKVRKILNKDILQSHPVEIVKITSCVKANSRYSGRIHVRE
jgi:hypothetical protein